jgi:hypothetical protein
MREHRVEPVVNKGETVEGARERLLKVTGDSDMTLAMRMNHPENLRLRWERKG